MGTKNIMSQMKKAWYDEEGLVLGVVTTATNMNEISNLEEVLQRADLPENIPVKVAKGYQSKKHANLLTKEKSEESYAKKS